MKLYILRNSPNVRKVLAVMHHLNIDIELIYFQLENQDTRQADFLAINPNGKTPTLVDGDFVMWESNAIVQYLADKSGADSLYPKDIKQRADINRWLFWEANHYGRAVGDLLWENFAKQMFTGEAADAAALQDATERFHECAALLEQQLNNKKFITSDQVSLADFTLACHAGFLAMGQVPLADYPQIAAWYQRMDEVSGWQESAPEMG